MAPKEPYSLIFCGNSEFSVPFLKKLVDTEDFDVKLVITNPDRPAGRKHNFISNPVKEFAKANSLPLLEIDLWTNKGKIKGELPSADLCVVVSYGQIIPKWFLQFPPKGCINIHASLLPQLRGATPIQTAILKGFRSTGLSIQEMVEGLDEGDIIGRFETEIKDSDNYETLKRKLELMGQSYMVKTVLSYLKGQIKPIPQEKFPESPSYCYINSFCTHNAEINWSESTETIDRQIRAFYNCPTAWCNLLGRRIQILEAKPVKPFGLTESQEPGEVYFTQDKKVLVRTADGYLRLKRVKPAGKNELTEKNFWCGYNRCSQE